MKDSSDESSWFAIVCDILVARWVQSWNSVGATKAQSATSIQIAPGRINTVRPAVCNAAERSVGTVVRICAR